MPIIRVSFLDDKFPLPFLRSTFSMHHSTAKAEVLLAYGPSADKRWKDLLSVAVAEDAMTASNSGTLLTVY